MSLFREKMEMLQQEYLDRAMAIFKVAEERGVVLRLMGAVAVAMHCPKFFNLHKKLGREFTDLDFMSYRRQRESMERLFLDLGYKSVIRDYGYGDRRIFIDPATNLTVDVFMDELRMCHTISFKTRLEVDSPTISLADLLLEKMQIVRINEKDLKDVIVLLREHNVDVTDEETINVDYIAKILSKDWGFYYTVTTNLQKLKDRFLTKFKVLTDEDRSDVDTKVKMILRRINEEPKSLGWKMRARIGTRKKWYEDVEEMYPEVFSNSS
jgi:hypothetical protein